jgi:hypothetical protein
MIMLSEVACRCSTLWYKLVELLKANKNNNIPRVLVPHSEL